MEIFSKNTSSLAILSCILVCIWIPLQGQDTANVLSSADSSRIAREKQLARNGDIGAQLNLGEWYRFGKYGLPEQPDSSNTYLLMAARQGDPAGQYLLGVAHLRGLGQVTHPDTGLKWLKASAEQSYLLAHKILLVWYADTAGAGHGHPARAITQAQALVHHKQAEGYRHLARAYAHGLGTSGNDSLALHYLMFAANQLQDPISQLTLAQWYIAGTAGLDKDYIKAWTYLNQVQHHAKADFETSNQAQVEAYYLKQRIRLMHNLHFQLAGPQPDYMPQLKSKGFQQQGPVPTE